MFFEAEFHPSKKMKYNDEAKNLAGKKIAVQEGWMINEGPFTGQQCFYIPNTNIGWIPACDLKDLKPISFSKWKAMQKSLGLSDEN